MNAIISQTNTNAIIKTECDLPPHITFEQFKKVYYELAGNQKDQVLWGLLWETGARVNDVLSLRWKDIDLDSKSIKLYVDKRNIVITLTIAEGLISDLKNFMVFVKPELTDYLFIGEKKDSHYTRQAAYDKLRGWGAKWLGLPPKAPGCLHPHMLRHGLAIYLMYSAPMNTDISGRAQLIAARLGHSNINTTLKNYLVITPEVQRFALKDVEWR